MSLALSSHYVLRPRPGLGLASVSLGAPCQQTCFIMAPKTGPKKVLKTCAIEGQVASGLGTHKEKKVCVDIHVQAAGSQICLQNICGQQRNSPMAPIFDHIFIPSFRSSKWTPKWGPELDHIFIPSFRAPFWGPDLDPKVGPAIGKFCCCPQMFCKQICDALA